MTPFRLFQIARFSTSTALQMTSVAVGWIIYDMTRRPLSLGLVGLAQFLPMLCLSLPAGTASDRFDRRRLLVMCNAVLGCSVALLPALRSPAQVYPLLVVVGAARAFIGPAHQAILPSLVPEDRLAQAVASTSTMLHAGMVAGPALGGVLYKAGGPRLVFGASAALFGVALAAAFLLPPSRARGGDDDGVSGLRAALSGVAYVWRSNVILGAISLDMFAVLFGGAVALLPIYAREILHAGPGGLGLLRGAPAIGALAAGALLARRPLARRTGVKLLVSVAAFGVATLVFGLSRNFALSVAMLVVAGAADMVSVVVRLTLVQLATPDEMRGRVSAMHVLFISASNELGEMESGVTAEWMGAVGSVVFGGLATCVVVLLCSFLFPALRRIDRLDDVKPA